MYFNIMVLFKYRYWDMLLFKLVPNETFFYPTVSFEVIGCSATTFELRCVKYEREREREREREKRERKRERERERE